MSILPLLEILPRLAGSFTLDNTVGLIACLAGIAGGWYITNRNQMKAKKAKIEPQKDDFRPRD